MHEQSASVKLLTILNVQSAKPPSSNKKRSSSSSSTSSPSKSTEQENGKKEIKTRDWHSIAKKAKKVKLDNLEPTISSIPTTSNSTSTEGETQESQAPEETTEEEDKEDSFKLHFGSTTSLVENVHKDQHLEGGLEWDKKRVGVKGLGECQVLTPKGSEGEGQEPKKEKSGLDLASPVSFFPRAFPSLY